MAKKTTQEQAETTNGNGLENSRRRGHGRLAKKDAVRLASEAGADLPPPGVAYIKEHFSLDMTNQQFSSNKTLLRADARRRGRRPGRPPRQVGAMVEMVAPAARSRSEILLEAARRVKELCDRYGARTVKGLA